MKICFVSNRYYPGIGGTELLLQKNAEEFTKRGYAVTVICSNFKNSYGAERIKIKEEMHNSVKIVRVSSIRLFNRDALTLFINIPLLLSELKKADIIHTFTFGYFTSWFVGLLKLFRLIKQPVVFSPHYGENNVYPRWLVALYMETLGRVSIKTADVINLLTPAYLEFFKKFEPKQISIIPPIVEALPKYAAEEIKKLRENLGIFKSEIAILSLSRVTKAKGIHLLLEGFSEYVKTKKAKLIIAGNGEYLKQLSLNVRNFKLENSVIFISDVNEQRKIELFNICDIFALLTYSGESFGITTVEAMSLGKPVLASKYGALPYVVTNKINGAIVDPFNKEEVTRGIEFLVKSREKFLKVNSEKLKEFQKEVIIQKYENLYRSLLK